DIEQEGKLHACLREVAQNGLAAASHDVADGGLFITLLEMAMPNGLGFDIVTDDEVRLDGFLFGEGQGRAVVSLKEEDQDDFFDVCEAHGLQPTLLGHVTKGKVVVDDKHFGFCEELRAYYDNALEEILTED
ncbi:MAG: AIR synthase-related protein, partial [Bacteroidota bacterium]|nr:AIR synthase-related protein [Bacteroidota bacterium]